MGVCISKRWPDAGEYTVGLGVQKPSDQRHMQCVDDIVGHLLVCCGDLLYICGR